MRFHNVVIESFAYHLPDEILTSSMIENELVDTYQRLNLPEGRLELMTGIHSRRIYPVGTMPSEISAMAADKLFSISSVKKSEVDLFIHASVCRDFLEPSTASVAHQLIGLASHCMIYDLSNACLGVISAIVNASAMIESGMINNALIVSGENSGPLLKNTIRELKTNQSITRKEIKKYIANLTLGSAGTAIMLSSTRRFPTKPLVLGGTFLTDSSANHLCRGDGNPHTLTMETDSETLLKHGLILANKNFDQFQKELNIKKENIDLVLTHQVGSAHEAQSLATLNLKNHPTFKTYPHLGNTGSSALPLTLIEAFEKNKINPNDTVAMLGIGSGLVSFMLGVQWK